MQTQYTDFWGEVIFSNIDTVIEMVTLQKKILPHSQIWDRIWNTQEISEFLKTEFLKTTVYMHRPGARSSSTYCVIV